MSNRREHVPLRSILPAFMPLILVIVSCAALSPETVSVQSVQQSPDAYLNRTVEWGGIIVENPSDNKALRVARTGLDQANRPSIVDRGEGFYLVRLDGSVDPEKYRSGRLIRVTGKITGVQRGTLEGKPYEYPVLTAVQIRVWSKEELIGINHFHWHNDYFWWPYVSFWGRCPGYPSPI